MNRTLGFGIVAVGALPMLVTGASPAAAHGGQNLQSSQGVVVALTAIGEPGYHYSLLVQDTVAGDNTWVRGEYTLVNGAKGGITAPMGGLTQTPTAPRNNQITAMRKCQSIGPNNWQCSGWVGV